MTQRQFPDHHNCYVSVSKAGGVGWGWGVGAGVGLIALLSTSQIASAQRCAGRTPSRTMKDLHPWVWKTGPSPLVGLEGVERASTKRVKTFQALRSRDVCIAELWVCMDLSPPSPLLFLPLEGKGKMGGNVYLMLCPIIAFWDIPCGISTGSQPTRDFALG